MFTRCPECKTIFRVTDEQLGAAGGRVRCGHCATIFNARDSLADSAAQLQQPATPKAGGGESPAPADNRRAREPQRYATDYSEFLPPRATPQSEEARPPATGHRPSQQSSATSEPPEKHPTPEATPPAASGNDRPFAAPGAQPGQMASAPSPHTQASDDRRPDEPERREENPQIADFEAPKSAEPEPRARPRSAVPARHTDEPSVQAPGEAAPEPAEEAMPVASPQPEPPPGREAEPSSRSNAGQAQYSSEPAADHEPIPSILEDDLQALARRRSGWRSFAWSVLVIGLVLAFGIQYAYFNRTDLARDPMLRPWLQRACQWAGCTIPLAPELNKLRFLNSTVMVDPQQDDRLLILATMVNTAHYPQPYPLLEVRLTNLDGKVVAMRRFKPKEYLPNDMDVTLGLQPDTPLSVKLEVVKPQQSVSGYQFEFR